MATSALPESSNGRTAGGPESPRPGRDPRPHSSPRSDLEPAPRGLHVAIILDGNGRWAVDHGLPRSAGHRVGVERVRDVVTAAPDLGIATLTLYAFSSDNWQRPPHEVRALFELLGDYLRGEAEACRRHGVRLRVIGRRDRLPFALRAAIEAVEASTAAGAVLELRLALDYSSRDAILKAALSLNGATGVTREEFAARVAAADRGGSPASDVDLLIRTGGEQRLSDFLLWECAYAELVFTRTLWPDFTASDLTEAIREFRGRERRFGGLSEQVAG